jgi:hypothetical protein
MESLWKEAVVAYFKVLSRYLPIEVEESHGNLARTAIVQAEIRTEHLQNASKKHYHLSQIAQ